MPGRHRHSPPLHKLLPPLAIAGVSVAGAAGAWLSAEPLVLRGLAAGIAVAAIAGTVLMRSWDREAGKRVAELRRARESDGWAHEERVAELEGDLEELRAIRAKLGLKLREKRTEIARLRSEHAALLRRYATAEAERARALEGRRRLAIEAAPAAPEIEEAPARPQVASSAAGTARAIYSGPAEGLTPVAFPGRPPSPGPVTTAVGEPGGATPSAAEGRTPRSTPPLPTPSLFLRARAALDALAAQSAALDERAPDADAGRSHPAPAEPAAEQDKRPALGAERQDAPGAPDVPTAEDGPTAQDGPDSARHGRTGGALPAAGRPQVPAAAAVPPAAPVRQAPQGGFDFFGTKSSGAGPARPAAPTPPFPQGTRRPRMVRRPGELGVTEGPGESGASRGSRGAGQSGAGGDAEETGEADGSGASPKPGAAALGARSAWSAALDTVRNEDLADVVGEEALALHKAEAEARFKPAGDAERGVGQVIDLTAHDDPERIDVSGLRDAVS